LKAPSSVSAADVAAAQAQLNLDDATLTAPFAGVVATVNVVPGSPVTGGTSVVRLLDRSTSSGVKALVRSVAGRGFPVGPTRP
jgi:multidrug resistance efflux pump